MGWKVEGSLLDGVDFDIKEAWFGIREGGGENQDKRNYLHLRGEASEDGEVVDDEYELTYSLGDGWEVTKNGKAVKHVAGKENFHKRSAIGKLITALAKLSEGDADLKAVLDERPEPAQAETWPGMIWRMAVNENEFKNRETEEVVKYEETFPVEFLGMSDGGSKPAAKTTAKPASKTRSTTTRRSRAKKDDEGAEEEEAPKSRSRSRSRAKKDDNSELREAVVAFAAEFEDDHEFFLEQVIDANEFEQADALQADDELMNDAMDPEGSIWTESRERREA